MLSTILAAASNSDVNLLFVLLAFVCFGCALYLAAARRDIAAALIAAFIGVLVLVFAL